MIILGIETSCDETAASIVENGRKILSSVVASQIDIHHKYGGVVPELASRKHVEAIVPVVKQAFETAKTEPENIDGIAVTRGPGLVGALLVGFSFAKAYAHALKIPWYGVNHLEGHIHSLFLMENPPDFPFTALLVSGGHTNIYHVTSPTDMELMGQTMDDAAGEAFDKVAKMMGLGYPGGAVIGKMAEKGDPVKIKFPRSFLDKSKFDFSFSGIKTSVKRYIETSGNFKDEIYDIAAGFQEAVVDVLSFKLIKAALSKNCKKVAIAGGVAANKRLRDIIIQRAAKEDMRVFIPYVSLCGDNGAMIAAAGYHYLKDGITSSLNEDVYSRHPIRLKTAT